MRNREFARVSIFLTLSNIRDIIKKYLLFSFMSLKMEDYTVPEFCTPDNIRYLSEGSGAILDMQRFFISPQLIQEMPEYLSQVNQIISEGSVYWLSDDSLSELQEYLIALQSDIANSEKWKKVKLLSTALNNFESRDRWAAIWLYTYLELRDPTPNPDDFVWPPTASQVSELLDIDIDMAWERFKEKATKAGLF